MMSHLDPKKGGGNYGAVCLRTQSSRPKEVSINHCYNKDPAVNAGAHIQLFDSSARALISIILPSYCEIKCL